MAASKTNFSEAVKVARKCLQGKINTKGILFMVNNGNKLMLTPRVGHKYTKDGWCSNKAPKDFCKAFPRLFDMWESFIGGK